MQEAPITRVGARAYTIPTDAPEADGTLAWDRTTLVIVEIEAGGQTGLGYTYADASLVPFIENTLAPLAALAIFAAAWRRSTALMRASSSRGLEGLPR